MQHESRQFLALQSLLIRQRVAALGTLNADGTPLVSMVPYAQEPSSCRFWIHVSALAAHTSNIQRNPHVSLMVMQPEAEGQGVHALPRVTLQGKATLVQDPESPLALKARAIYLERFAQAQEITTLPDFRFVAIDVHAARQVAGFGAARDVDPEELMRILADQS